MGFADEAAVAFEIVGEMVADLGFHFRLVAGVFERLAIVPSDTVEGFAGDDLHVVGGFFSCEGEEFIEEKRSGEDGGAGVVSESFVAEDGGATAGLFEGFEESDVVAAGLEANGGGESAEARANDEGWGAGGRGQGGGWGLGGAAEGGEVVEIEDIEPGGDVFPLRVRGLLVAIHPFALVDGCGGASVHEVGPSFDFLTCVVMFLIFFDPAEDFAISQAAGDLFF